VSPLAARHVNNLYTRNERIVCICESARGPFAIVMVGAAGVGGMVTKWHGRVNQAGRGEWDYATGAVSLAQGAELGKFLIGSTVIVLMPRGVSTEWVEGQTVRARGAMAA
jgi:phosphatidylserine decarboxylase